MRRIIIIGSGGAGKSTLARRLGARLGLEVIHLDRHHWRPGWIEPPEPEWRRTVEALVQRDAWIIDGNYSSTLAPRIRACDTIVLLDLPRLVCVWGVLRRVFSRRERPDMAPGCPEQVSLEFLLWVWRYPERSRPRVLQLVAELGADKPLVRLRSRAEVERFLARVA